MSLEAPTPPDPAATAQAQAKYNTQAAQSQAELNMVNQSTPMGSLSYTQTGTAADGTPQYTANTSLSAPEQKLFDATTGTQAQLATDAGTLATNLGPSLTTAPNLSTDATTRQLMKWQSDYMTPYFTTQNSNLDSQLAAQGITQGSAAYDNAKRQLQQSQGGTMENAMAGDEAQAYGQALSSYQAPIQTLGTLLGEGSPSNVNSSLTQTPSETVQPPNYQGAVEQNYQQQNQQYENTMAGLFGVASSAVGGWARMGMPAPSDRRIKRDIVRVGRLDNGLPVYRFRFKGNDATPHIGLMAQDVLEFRPEAVVDMGGFLGVDYELAARP